jgi:ABC-type uncharacterized transport system auxiliary subunit
VNRLLWLAGVVAITTASGGCLFRTAEAPRFYRPASVALDGAGETSAEDAAGTNGTADAKPIRLRAVRSAPFLRERMVWRASDVEYGLYEQRRWSELPSRYVRRALTTALQNGRSLRIVDDVNAPRLDVELLAFDEVVAPKHEASVALGVTVRDGERTRLDRTYASRVAIATGDGAATAQAMGKALDQVSKKVADAVTSALRGPSAAAPARRSHK